MSGAGLPRATCSEDSAVRNDGRSPDASSTTSISSCGEELASPSGQRAAIAVTASAAPGSSGRCRAYRPAIASITARATAGAGIPTLRSSLRYADHSPVDMPISLSCVSGSHRPPRPATSSRRTSSHTGSESISTPSMSNTTASIMA
jgi:hypothetical protein